MIFRSWSWIQYHGNMDSVSYERRSRVPLPPECFLKQLSFLYFDFTPVMCLLQLRVAALTTVV